MAEMTIQLRRNPVTGKQDVTVSLSSDEDALPHEHEQMHRALVDRLIEGGILSAAELGQIVVEREQPQAAPESPVPAAPVSERQAQGTGH